MAFALSVFEGTAIPEGGAEAILSILDKKAGTLGYCESIGWMTRALEVRAKQYADLAQEPRCCAISYAHTFAAQ
jgi:hypothetical protein